MATQVRDVVGFNEIVFQMFGDLTIEQADQESLTLEDWVLAEKDLVTSLETDGLLKR